MRAFVRNLGEVMITLGLVLLLFVSYQLWWTNVLADRAASQAANAITDSWKASLKDPPAELTKQPPEGTGFALMTIPRLGSDVEGEPVIQGVSLEVLAEGIGHYPGTAMPGQVGNFATAAHRATHGEPLRYVDQLQVGDNVYVQTQGYWYTYKLVRTQIVSPADTWSISPQPFDVPLASNRLLTLTTCNPRWASYERWIWWGTLSSKQPRTQGPPRMVVNG